MIEFVRKPDIMNINVETFQSPVNPDSIGPYNKLDLNVDEHGTYNQIILEIILTPNVVGDMNHVTLNYLIMLNLPLLLDYKEDMFQTLTIPKPYLLLMVLKMGQDLCLCLHIINATQIAVHQPTHVVMDASVLMNNKEIY